MKTIHVNIHIIKSIFNILYFLKSLITTQVTTTRQKPQRLQLFTGYTKYWKSRSDIGNGYCVKDSKHTPKIYREIKRNSSLTATKGNEAGSGVVHSLEK